MRGRIAWVRGLLPSAVAAAAVVLIAADVTDSDHSASAPSAMAASGWTLAASFTDYAPSGMPDFDQRKPRWRSNREDVSRERTFTHDGPLAAAAALWWLDSKLEPGESPPPARSDGAGIITSFGDWDDHSPENLMPLVDQLALAADTNGSAGATLPYYGTCIDRLVEGIDDHLEAAPGQRYVARTVWWPSTDALEAELKAGRPVILLLGLWQQYLPGAGDWARIGGHYVTLQAVDSRLDRIMIADPFKDTATGDPGDPDVHDDAAIVSHDPYLVSPSLRPEARPVLRVDGYLDGPGVREMILDNFQNHNRGPCDRSDAPWLPIVRQEAQLDVAIVIEKAPPPTPTNTPTSTPTRTPTPTVTRTATATSTATAPSTSTSTAIATRDPAATLDPIATSDPSDPTPTPPASSPGDPTPTAQTAPTIGTPGEPTASTPGDPVGTATPAATDDGAPTAGTPTPSSTGPTPDPAATDSGTPSSEPPSETQTPGGPDPAATPHPSTRTAEAERTAVASTPTPSTPPGGSAPDPTATIDTSPGATPSTTAAPGETALPGAPPTSTGGTPSSGPGAPPTQTALPTTIAAESPDGICGRVIGAASGAPVPNAAIWLQHRIDGEWHDAEQAIASDDQGRFCFHRALAGRYRVIVKRPECDVATRSILHDPPTAPARMTIALACRDHLIHLPFAITRTQRR